MKKANQVPCEKCGLFCAIHRTGKCRPCREAEGYRIKQVVNKRRNERDSAGKLVGRK